MVNSSIDVAILAADRAVDRIAERLKDDLDSLSQQLDEINSMMTYDIATDANRVAFKNLTSKILALYPDRPETRSFEPGGCPPIVTSDPDHPDTLELIKKQM
jgi:hypothetical protein